MLESPEGILLTRYQISSKKAPGKEPCEINKPD